MSPELESRLTERHPKIFTVCEDGDSRPTLRWGFECGDGWYQVIDTLCACIQQHVDTYKLKQVTAKQVKEKFAELRFYYSGGDERIHGMVELAVALSVRVCPVCGKPGERIKTKENGMVTRCDEHKPKEESGPV